MKMDQQEKKVIADIKKLAKDNQMDAVKIMAKDLVRTRRQSRKFMLMKANIQVRFFFLKVSIASNRNSFKAVSLKIQTLKSQNTMAQAMKGVSRAMANMNRQMNMPQIQQILHEFEKQSEIMDMKEEMINDAIDDAMEDEGDEEEGDAIVAQVLDELGLQLNDQLSGLPQVWMRFSKKIPMFDVFFLQASGSLSVSGVKQPQAAAVGAGGSGGSGGGGAAATTPISDADDELQKRLDNLRRE